VMVRAEGEPVVCEAEPQPDRGVPTVRAGDESVVDVVERGLYAESPEGRDESTPSSSPTPSAKNSGAHRLSSRYGKCCDVMASDRSGRSGCDLLLDRLCDG
jgi:hypothetical protein